MKKYLISLLAVFAALGAAHAADINKAPTYSPTGYSWTGFYLGAHVGAAVNTDDAEVASNENTSTSVGGTPAGFVGGVDAGFDYQYSSMFVVGAYIQQDFAHLGRSGAGVLGSGFALSDATNYLGAAGARFGVLLTPQLLAYGKGGLAWGGAKPNFAALGTSQAVTDTSVGWQVGTGLEYALTPKLHLRLEYDHTQLGDKQLGIGTAPDLVLTSTTRYSIEEALFGVAYRF